MNRKVLYKYRCQKKTDLKISWDIDLKGIRIRNTKPNSTELKIKIKHIDILKMENVKNSYYGDRNQKLRKREASLMSDTVDWSLTEY